MNLANLKYFLEYLGGVHKEPPQGVRFDTTSLWWGVYWASLVALIIVFCGQSSKFIYIDF